MNEFSSEPYIAISELKNLPNPLQAIEAGMLAVAFVICFAGWIMNIVTHKESDAPEFSSFIRLLVTVSLISFSGPLSTLITDIMYYFPRELIANGGGINSAGDKIRYELGQIMANEGTDPDFFSFFRIGIASFVSNILITLFNLLALLGSLIMVVFYFIHYFAVKLGVAGLPIALACFNLPAMRDKATNYILSFFSVLSWPFFLVVVNTAAGYVFLIAGEDPLPPVWGTLGDLIAPLISAMILLAGSMSVPLFSYFLWTTGGGYLPPGTAGQVMNTAGTLGGMRNMLRGVGRGGAN